LTVDTSTPFWQIYALKNTAPYIAMDSPPHISKPLRTILLETASEEKVEAHPQVFHQEMAEIRFGRCRTIPKNSKCSIMWPR
jgi:hypothetical protein